MTRILLAFSTMLFLNTAALAGEIDTEQSVITWNGSKVTGDHHGGQISPRSSSIKLSDGAITSGEIVFEMSSLTVTNLEGQWKDKFLGHIKSPDFFDVAKFPTATLKLHGIADGEATGELTVKGVTLPISFPVRRVDEKYVGKATFDRTKFGITYGSGSFFENLGDKVINDTVDVEFTLVVKGE